MLSCHPIIMRDLERQYKEPISQMVAGIITFPLRFLPPLPLHLLSVIMLKQVVGLLFYSIHSPQKRPIYWQIRVYIYILRVTTDRFEKRCIKCT